MNRAAIMQLSVKYQFAFLCMPKCASTSIEAVLADYAEINFSGHPAIKHITAANFNQTFKPYIQQNTKTSIETFCLVREPVAWLNSWYRYRQRLALKTPNTPQHRNYTGNISFAEFVEGYLSPEQPPYALVGSQTAFVSMPNGRIGVDRIFRVEDMDQVERFLSNKLSTEISIDKLNVSPKSDKGHLPPSLKAELQRHLAADFELYESAGRRTLGK